MRILIGLSLVALIVSASPAAAQTRVKDVASLDGYQATPLIGYGLVVGLNKTGDKRQTVFTAQSLASMLEKLGVGVDGSSIKIENTAAVLVTAELPPFARQGARLDVTAASVGDARSLQGGILLATALRGPDGATYALAQGALSIGGFGGGRSGNSVQVNHLTVGRVPGGGLVEASQHTAIKAADEILLSLREADYGTAHRLADVISVELGDAAAKAVDPGTVSIKVPAVYRDSVPDLIARIEPLRVDVDVTGARGDQRAHRHRGDRRPTCGSAGPRSRTATSRSGSRRSSTSRSRTPWGWVRRPWYRSRTWTFQRARRSSSHSMRE